MERAPSPVSPGGWKWESFTRLWFGQQKTSFRPTPPSPRLINFVHKFRSFSEFYLQIFASPTHLLLPVGLSLSERCYNRSQKRLYIRGTTCLMLGGRLSNPCYKQSQAPPNIMMVFHLVQAVGQLKNSYMPDSVEPSHLQIIISKSWISTFGVFSLKYLHVIYYSIMNSSFSHMKGRRAWSSWYSRGSRNCHTWMILIEVAGIGLNLLPSENSVLELTFQNLPDK